MCVHVTKSDEYNDDDDDDDVIVQSSTTRIILNLNQNHRLKIYDQHKNSISFSNLRIECLFGPCQTNCELL